MVRTLGLFWLKRFALVFVLASLGLGLVEVAEHGLRGFSCRSVASWAAATAFLASSFATYWAYKIRCKVVFKAPVE